MFFSTKSKAGDARIGRRIIGTALVAAGLFASSPTQAGIGDLLVAPTRLILDGRHPGEVILNNIGDEPATYRVSIQFRRMTADGVLEDVAEPSAQEKLTEDMVVFQPRRVTLAPNQPQSIRVWVRPPQGIPDGEYRVHLLFRAIPPAKPAAQAPTDAPSGLRFALTPVYGVTIPVIVRLGNLDAKAGISNVQLEDKAGAKSVSLELSRSGSRSTYGDIRVLKPGVKDPIALQKAVAVYTDVPSRKVSIPIEPSFKGDVHGPVTIQYVETYDDGSHTIAETQAVLR